MGRSTCVLLLSFFASFSMLGQNTPSGLRTSGTESALETHSASPLPASSQPLSGGTLIRYDAFPSSQIEPLNVYVWVPKGYAEGHGRYDVIYLGDGQNLFVSKDAYGGQTWEIAAHLQGLIDSGKVRPAILVGVWNAEKRRGQEYAPTGGQSAANLAVLASDWGGPIVSDRYIRFVTDELKPFIDRNYRTLPEREHTFAMGSSMGGLIALELVIERPDMFGGAACLSTHWLLRWLPGLSDMARTKQIAESYLQYVDQHLPSPADHKFYFDHGTETYDAYYGPYQEQMDTILKKHGYVDGVSEESLVFPGAAHNEQAWRARVDKPLVFLLGK
jgi:enterochelin esterase-like enzyme